MSYNILYTIIYYAYGIIKVKYLGSLLTILLYLSVYCFYLFMMNTIIKCILSYLIYKYISIIYIYIYIYIIIIYNDYNVILLLIRLISLQLLMNCIRLQYRRGACSTINQYRHPHHLGRSCCLIVISSYVISRVSRDRRHAPFGDVLFRSTSNLDYAFEIKTQR